jgi:deoxyribose-phosphate aldolase
MGSPPSPRELAAFLDHTLLAPGATAADVERLCAEAREHGFAAVCVNGAHVRRCSDRMAGTPVKVCAVVGFPLGASDPRAKIHEARLALECGARELDMVLQIGALRAGEHALVVRDIAGVVGAASAERALVKVILETGLLSRDEIAAACRLAEEAGAGFVKTSTGFGPRGASCEDVELMHSCVGSRLGIKAAGGIRTASFALELLAAGATRLGCSASVALVREAEAELRG